MARLDLTNTALAQIREIGEFIAQDNPYRAASFLDELIAAMRLRSEMPLSGRARPELDGNPRSFPFGDYVVLYEPLDGGEGILVLGVMHARQDFSRAYRP